MSREAAFLRLLPWTPLPLSCEPTHMRHCLSEVLLHPGAVDVYKGWPLVDIPGESPFGIHSRSSCHHLGSHPHRACRLITKDRTSQGTRCSPLLSIFLSPSKEPLIMENVRKGGIFFLPQSSCQHANKNFCPLQCIEAKVATSQPPVTGFSLSDNRGSVWQCRKVVLAGSLPSAAGIYPRDTLCPLLLCTLEILWLVPLAI